MPGVYTVVGQGTVTAAGTDADFVELTPADDKPIALLGLKAGNWSEVGDSAEEGVRVSIIRLPATVTSGSGGSSPTPQKTDSAQAAAGFTAEVNNTTVATTSGTAEILEEWGWNIRASPLEMWWPDPKTQYKARQGEVLAIRMQTTLGDDASFGWTAIVEEL